MAPEVIEETPAPPEESRELDAHVSLLEAYDECRRNIDFWKQRQEKVKAELDAVMGSATVGTVEGSPVLTYRYENRFQGSEFRKTYPDTYRMFTHEVTKTEFDLDWFKRSRPDLYDQFRVRSLKSQWEGVKRDAP
jgi:hypothetical protein